MSPSDMKNFFANQSYLQLVKTFGYLDIYEYVDSKPSFYVSLFLRRNQALLFNQTLLYKRLEL